MRVLPRHAADMLGHAIQTAFRLRQSRPMAAYGDSRPLISRTTSSLPPELQHTQSLFGLFLRMTVDALVQAEKLW